MARSLGHARLPLAAILVAALVVVCCLGGAIGTDASVTGSGGAGANFGFSHSGPFSAFVAVTGAKTRVVRAAVGVQAAAVSGPTSVALGMSAVAACQAHTSGHPLSMRLRL